jgi:hypothetical protein
MLTPEVNRYLQFFNKETPMTPQPVIRNRAPPFGADTQDPYSSVNATKGFSPPAIRIQNTPVILTRTPRKHLVWVPDEIEFEGPFKLTAQEILRKQLKH